MSETLRKIEALEAELQKLKNEVKQEPKMDANKWYWFGFKDECNKRYLILFDRVVEKGYFYKYMINTLSEHYLNKQDDYISKSNTFLGEATHKEVEEALKRQAIKMGFKEGVRFRTAHGHGALCKFPKHLEFNSTNNTLSNYNFNDCIFKDGVWAEIVKDETIKIGGYSVEKIGESYRVGCKRFEITDFIDAKRLIEKAGVKSLCFESIEINIETINKILAL